LSQWAGRGLNSNLEPQENHQILLINWVAMTVACMSFIWVFIWASLSLWYLATLALALSLDCVCVVWLNGRHKLPASSIQRTFFFSLLLASWATADRLGPDAGAFMLPAIMSPVAIMLGRLDRFWEMALQAVIAQALSWLAFFMPHIIFPPAPITDAAESALMPLYVAGAGCTVIAVMLYEKLGHEQTLRRLILTAEAHRRNAHRLKETQEREAQTHKRLDALLDGSTALNVLLNRDGIVLAFNQVFARYAQELDGITHAVGSDFFQHTNDNKAWFRPYFEQAKRGETVRVLHEFIVPASGSVFLDVALTPFKDENGAVDRIVLTSLDVTQNHTEEIRHRALESNLQALIDNSEQAIWSVDRQYRLLTINSTFRNFQDSVRQRPVQIGDIVFEPFDEPTQNYWRTLYNRAFAGERLVVEWNNPLANAMTEIRMSPIVGANGEITGAAVMVLDVTARKQAELQLAQAKEEAELASLVKSRFLAHVSHDLRNPVHAIMGCVSVLNETILSESQKPVAQMLERASRRLRDNLENLLDYTRLEAGRLELKAEPFDLAQELADSAALYEMSAAQHKIKFTFKAPHDSLPTLLGDKTRLFRILDNIVDNAIKFTDEGEVALEVEAKPDEQVDRMKLRLTVRDTGTGIPPDKLTAIFDPFVQVDSSSKKNVQGIGLGLSIVRQLVELMKGHIEVESRQGEGTTVRIEIPFIIQNGKTLQTQDARVAARAMTNVNLLVAEDDEANALYLQRLFLNLGWRVKIACNGKEALRYVQRETFDAILMDGAMPVMDGMEAVERIRRNEELRPDLLHVPIIVVSGYARGEERDRFLNLGVQGFLTKPVNEEDLIAAILETLRQAQAENIA